MGEFNVNKSDGSLEQTAGMPATYPAEQVMMSDGVTSVEDALDEVAIKTYTATLTFNANGNAATDIPTSNKVLSVLIRYQTISLLGMPYEAMIGGKYVYAIHVKGITAEETIFTGEASVTIYYI